MATDTAPPSKPRRWVQRCVRVLIVVSLLLAGFGGYGLWSYERYQASLQQLESVADVGYTGRYIFPFQGKFLPLKTMLRTPHQRVPYLIDFRSGTQHPGRLLRTFNSPYLNHVIFYRSEIYAEDIDALADNEYLENVEFRECRFADEALSRLRSMPSLRRLSFQRCVLSPKDVVDFSIFPKLFELDLSRSNANDHFLTGLTDNPSLWKLTLIGISITDDGLRHLHRFPNLKHLHLGLTNVTGVGLVNLDSQIRELNLVGTKANDVSMATISRLSSLHNLDLARTKVTVKGVTQLKVLSDLRFLVLDECNVGDEVREPLKAFPKSMSWRAVRTRVSTRN